MEYKIQECSEVQLPEILSIFNEAILNSTALYDYKLRTMETMNLWYLEKKSTNSPIIGIFDAENILLGFATYGAFRVRPAYKYTVEHSVYVRADKRGLGLGRMLLQQLIEKATEQNFHVLIGVIDASNQASIKLHESFGFVLVGVMNQVGFKFGQWLNAAFYQLILDTPLNPTDDIR